MDEPPLVADMVPAGKGTRFAHFLVDWLATLAFATILGLGVGVLVALLGGVDESSLESPGFTCLSYVIGILSFVAYYFVLEASTGRTLGKLLTGCRVVSEGGYRPTATQILGRSFARLVPFEAFSVLFSGDGQGWHDEWSRTRVVKIRP